MRFTPSPERKAKWREFTDQEIAVLYEAASDLISSKDRDGLPQLLGELVIELHDENYERCDADLRRAV
jgi:hypothetical protein